MSGEVRAQLETESSRNATCVDCGVAIVWYDGDGQRVPLDAQEAIRGEHRYAVRDGRLVPVRADADVLASTDHRYTCSRRQRPPR